MKAVAEGQPRREKQDFDQFNFKALSFDPLIPEFNRGSKSSARHVYPGRCIPHLSLDE